MPSSAGIRHAPDRRSSPPRRSSDLGARRRSPGAPSARASRRAPGARARWWRVCCGSTASRSRRARGRLREPPERAATRRRATPSRRDRKSTRLNSSHLGISYAVFCWYPPRPGSTLLPSPTLFRSRSQTPLAWGSQRASVSPCARSSSAMVEGLLRIHCKSIATRTRPPPGTTGTRSDSPPRNTQPPRSEEHTSELQSLRHLVCRLLLVSATPRIDAPPLPDALPISEPDAARLGLPARERLAVRPELERDGGGFVADPLQVDRDAHAAASGNHRNAQRLAAAQHPAAEIGRAHV